MSKRLPDPLPLYDFLYRDAGRMASYYAQIFSGRLSSLEQTDSERTSEDKGAKLNIHVASGDLKQTRETARTAKRTIDPHDVITTTEPWSLSTVLWQNLPCFPLIS